MKETALKYNNLYFQHQIGEICAKSLVNAIPKTIKHSLPIIQYSSFISFTTGIESRTYRIANIHILKKNKFI